MPAAIKNLLIEQGATFIWTLVLKNGNGAASPALDLTGYSARMQLRLEVSTPQALVSLNSLPAGGIVITALDGRLDIEISAAATSALTFDKAVYDLELVQPNGKVLRLFKGSVALSLEVTRSESTPANPNE